MRDADAAIRGFVAIAKCVNRGRSCPVARGRTRSYIISRGYAQSFVSIGAKLSSGDEIQCLADTFRGEIGERSVAGALTWSQTVRETRGNEMLYMGVCYVEYMSY